MRLVNSTGGMVESRVPFKESACEPGDRSRSGFSAAVQICEPFLPHTARHRNLGPIPIVIHYESHRVPKIGQQDFHRCGRTKTYKMNRTDLGFVAVAPFEIRVDLFAAGLDRDGPAMVEPHEGIEPFLHP